MILYDKTIESKIINMDEYCVLHFYQVRPIIKFYLVFKIIYNMYTQFYILYTYDIL